MHHAKKGHRVISMDILEHLQKLYPALTKKQKTIADYLIANPEEISYITLAQLSHQTGTSELTLLRFCQKLGYSSFLDLNYKGAVPGLYPEKDKASLLFFLFSARAYLRRRHRAGTNAS